MKKILVLLAGISLGFSAQKDMHEKEISNSFTYLDIGLVAPLPYPGVTFGSRQKFDCVALDLSIGIYTVILCSDLSINAKCLKYFKDNTTYFGAGSSAYVGNYFGKAVVVLSPCVTVGKEIGNNFFQVDTSFIRVSNFGLGILPGITLRYGIKI